MVIIDSVSDAITSGETNCCTTCWTTSGLSVTLPCIACGKYLAIATMVAQSNTACTNTCFRFCDGGTSTEALPIAHSAGNFQTANLSLVGNADGGTLAVQWKPAAGTSTLQGSSAHIRSHLTVFATNGGCCVCTSIQKDDQTATLSTTSCSFQDITGLGGLTLACRSCGTAYIIATIGQVRNSLGGNGTVIEICPGGLGNGTESHGVNYAYGASATDLALLDGTSIKGRGRRVTGGTAAVVVAGCRHYKLDVFEIS